MEHPQKFLRAWALDALAEFSRSDRPLRAEVLEHLTRFEQSGSKALAARAKRIRERLFPPGRV